MLLLKAFSQVSPALTSVQAGLILFSPDTALTSVQSGFDRPLHALFKVFLRLALL